MKKKREIVVDLAKHKFGKNEDKTLAETAQALDAYLLNSHDQQTTADYSDALLKVARMRNYESMFNFFADCITLLNPHLGENSKVDLLVETIKEMMDLIMFAKAMDETYRNNLKVDGGWLLQSLDDTMPKTEEEWQKENGWEPNEVVRAAAFDVMVRIKECRNGEHLLHSPVNNI